MNVCFDTELIQRYGGRGPRYTSYPTALQFQSEFSSADYEAQAADSNETGGPLSLYIHIPFCQSLCYYCACNKVVTRNRERVCRYLDALHTEVELQARLFDDDRIVEQLHFGGGTPTYLDATQLQALMNALGRGFSLDSSASREFSIEVDPRTANDATIGELFDLGFNRLSLGIQDFDDKVQDAVNRKQSARDVAGLMSAARSNGFRSVSFDLIYGLPHQTVASFNQTLDAVIDMRPDRLAVYNYAHLPQRFKGQRMIRDDDIPAPNVKLDILQQTVSRLCEAGWEYIGMDHFALPDDELVHARNRGTLQRNFQGYSTHRHCDLVALGVSAIGHIGNLFTQNAVTTNEYQSSLEQGRLPIQKGLLVDYDDRIRAAVIQGLMCYDELCFDRIEREFDIDFTRYFSEPLQRLQPLAADDLLVLSDDAIRITPKGRLLLRSIAMVFDRHLPATQDDGRFSKSI